MQNWHRIPCKWTFLGVREHGVSMWPGKGRGGGFGGFEGSDTWESHVTWAGGGFGGSEGSDTWHSHVGTCEGLQLTWDFHVQRLLKASASPCGSSMWFYMGFPCAEIPRTVR